MTMPPSIDLAGAAIDLAERGWVPDAVTRLGIRRLCAKRLDDERQAAGGRGRATRLAAFIDTLRAAEVAPVPEKANAQHYEVPADFFGLMLGPQRKYSCCLWENAASLDEAEDAALAQTAARAGLRDGQRILELGCGWGSLTLWMARRFPSSTIVAVSNSTSQRAFIEARARRGQLSNIHIVTADMNHFESDATYDRIVSVEMFEHMRNYPALFARIAQWLAPGGRLFVHVFCHREFPYYFEETGSHNWMGRHFFSGGLMPSVDLLPSVPSPFTVEAQWTWDGRHYERTANAWLANLDARRDEALAVLAEVYGAADAPRWLERWRMFLMACAELFGYDGGREWGVAHYRFRRVS